MKHGDKAPQIIHNLFKQFKDATINELWDSTEQVLENYQKDSEYQKLLNGEAGINVLYHYLAIVTAECMDEWSNYVLETAHSLLVDLDNYNEELEKQFTAISNYCHGLAHNTMGKDRMFTNPEYDFEYDVMRWLNDVQGKSLSKFKLVSKSRIVFKLTEDQFKTIQDNIDIYGDTHVGKSKVLKMVPIQKLWRRPTIIK